MMDVVHFPCLLFNEHIPDVPVISVFQPVVCEPLLDHGGPPDDPYSVTQDEPGVAVHLHCKQ
jgi:hypothetical protein